MSEETADRKVCETLLFWINTFPNVKQPLNSLKDLTDSRILRDCLLFATPDKLRLSNSYIKC